MPCGQERSSISATLAFVVETSARLLRLLSLLQVRPDWPGTELAGRLAVTPRTLRRDIARLRSLGYPVQATPGTAGGYRLGAGASLPPLLLDDDEAVAVALSLHSAAAHSVTGVGEASVRALAKLEQVLPSRLRARAAAIAAATVPLTGPAPAVNADALVTITRACHRREQLEFGYRNNSGTQSRRLVEPHRLVQASYRWYLVARDTGRQPASAGHEGGVSPGPGVCAEAAGAGGAGQSEVVTQATAADQAGWRTFRVDRIDSPRANGIRFVPRDPPDAAAFVARGITTAPYRYQARILVRASASAVAERIPPSAGVVTAATADSCVLATGSDSLDALAFHTAMLGLPVQVLEPAELAERMRELADWLGRTASDSATHPSEL